MILSYFQQIEDAARGNARLAKIKEISGFQDWAAPMLKEILVITHDPFITYGIDEIPTYLDGDITHVYGQDDNGEQGWCQDLTQLLARLASRSLSGNAAKLNIAQFLAHCNGLQRKWAERILLKDLRLNIGAKEVQKIYGKDVINLFEVPLAKDYNDIKKWDPKKLWFAQPKLDGGRCVAFINGAGAVELLSRTGKTWGNFESVRLELVKLAKDYNLRSFVFDGEVVSLNEQERIDFQQIQKTMHRKSGGEVGTLQYIIFDGCRLSEWQTPQLPYAERLRALQDVFATLRDRSNNRLRLIYSEVVESTKAAAEAACAKFVELGYEGAILRDQDAVVELKRTKNLLKVKTFQDEEAIIVGLVEGTGQFVGMLGAFECVSKDGVNFEIGSGFDNAQRQEYWNQELIGQKVTYKFFEKTNDMVPRFPIFKGLRHSDDIS